MHAILVINYVLFGERMCNSTTTMSNKQPTSLENILPFEIWLYPIER